MAEYELKRKSDDDLQAIVRRAAIEAINWIESDVAQERLDAAKYFDGHVSIGHEEGRSKVVATKCRDVVRMVKPALMRIFMQSDKPVEYVPTGDEDVATAEEQTEYAHYVYNRNGGFQLLNAVIDDALRQKTGIAKVYQRNAKKSKMFEFEFTEDEFAMFAGGDGVEIITHELTPEGIHKGQAQRIETDAEIVMEAMPPEEFFIDSYARSIDDYYICGQQRELRVGDLVEMGFDFDDVYELGTTTEPGEVEAQYRRGDNSYYDNDGDPNDPSLRLVLYTEAYMRVDVEGTGVPQLYAFLMAGINYKLLDYYPVDEAPFAVFEIDPDPHTFHGRSLVDLVMGDQDAATAMLRGVLDNVAQTNAVGHAFDENKVNQDDMLNGEIGRLVRSDGSPLDAIMPLTVPFAAADILSAVQYYDQTIDNKTGVTSASAGLDPDALSNATATAVDATTRAAMAQPEVMARHLAEGGMKRLFRLLAKLIAKNPPKQKMMRLNNRFTEITPESWNPDFDITVNVGLGTGNESVKAAVLNSTLETQIGIWGQYGAQNGLVTLTNIRNTLADILVLGGIHNSSRYYQPMDMQMEQQMQQQAAQQAAQQPQQPDPYVQAEQIKAQVKAQDNQAQNQIKMMELMRRDDLERDKMAQDAILEAAKLLGQYDIQVDQNAIRAMQAQNNQGMA